MSGAAVNTGVVIPGYTVPSDPMWAAAIAARAAHPNVPICFIINPADGPGSAKDPAYVAGVTALKAAGILVLGYVNTNFTSVPISQAEAQAAQYHTWYPNVDGIFFDCMGNTPGQENYYASLTAFVKSLGMTYVMDNPGTSVPLTFIGLADSLLVYESGGYPAITMLSQYSASPKSEFGFIALGVPYNAAFDTKASSFVAWVYPTDQSGGNPYTKLPPYFSTLVAALDVGVAPPPGPTSTISVSAQDANGSPIPGLTVLLDDGAVQLDHKFTPAAFVAPEGQTYDLIIQESAAYSFSHWLADGSTLPDEKVLLGASDVALVAVMARRPVPPPPSQAIVQVNTADLSGNPLNGLYVSVKASARASYSPLAYTPKITLVASNYQNFIFNHWEDGSTNATRVIAKLSQPVTVTAYYST